MKKICILPVFLLIVALGLFGCSDSSDSADSDSGKADDKTTTMERPDFTPRPGLGMIHFVVGPESPEIISQGWYNLREDFELESFELSGRQYALMDSISNYPVIGYETYKGFDFTIDSLEPGIYNILVYVSRKTPEEAAPDTIITEEGDTIINPADRRMKPYEFYFRPILVDNVVVSANTISGVDLSEELETWRPPGQTGSGGWEAARARYHGWEGVTWD